MAGTLAVTVDMIPSAFLIELELFELGASVKSFKEPLKNAVQKVMSPSFQKNFDAEGRPPWQPLSDLTILTRSELGFDSGPILNRTGLLKRIAGQLNIWSIDQDSATVSNLGRASYGNFHQSGTAQMPAREWAVMQSEDMDAIEDVFIDWLQTRLARAGFIVGL